MRRDRTASAAAAALDGLERHIRGIPEPAMRRAVVREWIREQAPDALYAALRCALHRAPPGGSAFDPLLEAMHEVLREPPGSHESALPDYLRFEVYARAADDGDDGLLRLLRPQAAFRERDGPAGLPAEMADVPLGRRRSLAKGMDRRVLEQLGRDPDPTVIHNLLSNPRLRETDVLRLATRRPTEASSLEVIGEDPRWACRPAVRVALARNPYTPVPLALKMLNGLDARELREIRGDATLHPDVRAHAAESLRRRRRTASHR